MLTYPTFRMAFALLLLVSCAGVASAQDSPKLENPPKSEAVAPKLKEPYAADIKPDAVWDGRKLAPFKALDAPKMVKASEAGLSG